MKSIPLKLRKVFVNIFGYYLFNILLTSRGDNFNTNKWSFSLLIISTVIESEYVFKEPATNEYGELSGWTLRHRL